MSDIEKVNGNSSHTGTIVNSLEQQKDFIYELKSTLAGRIVAEDVQRLGISSREDFVNYLKGTGLFWLRGISIKRAQQLREFYGVPQPKIKKQRPQRRMPVAPVGDFSELGRELSAKMVPMQFNFKRQVGIYALRCGESVMYIGKTTHLLSRIAIHICEKPPFDNVKFMEVSEISVLGKFEIALIQHFKPPWNATYA